MPARLAVFAARLEVSFALLFSLYYCVFMLVNIAHFAFVCSPTQWRPGTRSVNQLLLVQSRMSKYMIVEA